MRIRHDGPANDPHPPASRGGSAGRDGEVEARLDALFHDRRTQRMLTGDRRARRLMLRLARAVRRELDETHSTG